MHGALKNLNEEKVNLQVRKVEKGKREINVPKGKEGIVPKGVGVNVKVMSAKLCCVELSTGLLFYVSEVIIQSLNWYIFFVKVC